MRYTLFGFNGKEFDWEVKGWQNQVDYGMRVYDPRIGKFLSVDPITKSFAMLTPYQFASNSPIAHLDLDGGESKYYNSVYTRIFDGENCLKKEEYTMVEDKSKEAGWFVQGAVHRSPGSLGEGDLFSFFDVKIIKQKDGSEQITYRPAGELFIPAPKNEKRGRGGLYFVSSNGNRGTSGSGSLSGDDAIPINLDLLVAAVGGFPKGNLDTEMSPFAYSGNQINDLTKLAEILKSNKDFATKIEKVLASFQFIIDLEQTGEKSADAVESFLEKLKVESVPKEDPLRFRRKGAIYYDVRLQANIERDTDSKGQMTRKKAKDTLKATY